MSINECNMLLASRVGLCLHGDWTEHSWRVDKVMVNIVKR